ncbi:MAG: NADH:flavin oxidoreductase [bacterium]|nr:NADH:flavin oxidoreductase [bacterium]
MPEIFESTNLAGIQLTNRLVRSATWEGLADEDGGVTSPLVQTYEQLADGGIGLIISSYLYVQPVGKQTPGQVGIYSDALLPGITRLATAVHERGGKIVGQIVHCGGQADSRTNGGLHPVAPSAVESPGYRETPQALSRMEIDEIVYSFADAARRLRDAGFDGVQLHGAHGYLLAQFLSPSRNVRTDEYGGDRSKRSRFCLDVYQAIRSAVGSGFPVLIKLNVDDFMEGSTTEQDSVFLATELAANGIDAIEVSGGTPGSGKLGPARPNIVQPEDEAYFLEQAKVIRSATGDLPLMLVGGLRSLDIMESVIDSGAADYLSMSRPLIREPDLPRRWLSGDRARAACVSCLGCFLPGHKGEGVRCVQKDKEA